MGLFSGPEILPVLQIPEWNRLLEVVGKCNGFHNLDVIDGWIEKVKETD